MIVNTLSGNSKRLADLTELQSLLDERYRQVDIVHIDSAEYIDMKKEIEGCDGLAVCGGDGTLNSAINAIKGGDTELIYVPCGTLNDTAKSLRLAKDLPRVDRKLRRIDIGQAGDTMFAYVLAGGTFTPIGYRTKTKTKKRFKLLAYFFTVLREYKIHRIPAKITVGSTVTEDEFTLIMVINNSRCFGFRFNKRFRHNDGKAQLLTIKAPKTNGLPGKIAMFFPFFRVFFLGLRKEKDGAIIKFRDFSEAKLELKTPYVFSVDGEKLTLNGEVTVKIHRQKLNLLVSK